MSEDVRARPVKSTPVKQRFIVYAGVLLVIFLLYAIFTSPTDAANMVGSAWDVITNGVGNIATFFDSLIARS